MKSIQFIFVGQSKNKDFSALEEHYFSRIKNYTSSQIQIVKDDTSSDSKMKVRKESQKVLERITKKDFVILCDERGREFSSVDFSKKISSWQDGSQSVVFVIGGAFGVDSNLIERADVTLSLSQMVLPHELARVFLLEQVYRAFTIQRGEKYHHH